MQSNLSLVTAFIHAINHKQSELVRSMLSEDCFYHNIPMEPVIGPDATIALLDVIDAKTEQTKWQINAIALSAEGHVLTERSDDFLINGEWLRLPVMGIFECDGQKIRVWRDYYDQNMMLEMLNRVNFFAE